MKNKLIMLILTIPFWGINVYAQNKQRDINKIYITKSLSSEEVNAKVNSLLAKMTIEEKVGQMAQITLDVVCKGEGSFLSYEPAELDMQMTRGALVNNQTVKFRYRLKH